MEKIAIISDIHGNYPAFEAVLEDIASEGADKILCLGDLVGYYCMINEVIDKIREMEIETIMGNHDFAMAYDHSYIARSNTCVKVQARQIQYISTDNLNFLKSLKRSTEFDFDSKSYFCVHGGLEDYVDQYLFSVDEQYFRRNDFHGDVLVVGHTHLPMNIAAGEYQLLNPGSVGKPHDGDPRSSYMLLTADGLIHKKIPYDIDRIAAKMREMHFDEYIYEILYRGVKIGQ